MDLFNRYDEHASRYDVFAMPKTELRKIVKPLEYRHVNFDQWLALKWAGSFFAYGRPVVWVYIVNNKSDKMARIRHNSRGFYVTITTYDDCALYGDWKEPFPDDAAQRVVDYFDALKGIEEYKVTCSRLNEILGARGDYWNS